MKTVAELCAILQVSFQGDGNLVLSGFNGLEDAGPQDLSFLEEASFTPLVYTTRAAAVLVPKDFVPKQKVTSTLIPVASPRATLAKLLAMWQHIQEKKAGIHPSAVVASDVSLGENVWIGPLCVVESGAVLEEGVQLLSQVYVGAGVHIGAHSVLHTGVKLLEKTTLGQKVILQANVVVGSDGFGYTPTAEGLAKIPHLGGVIIEDEVEIGAGSTIDRAVFGNTQIGKGVKLDNLIQVAHNVRIGAHTVVAAQTGIAGSARIGAYCRIGGQVGISDHAEVPDGSEIGAQSGWSGKGKKPKQKWLGSPVMDAQEYKKLFVLQRRLPQLMKKMIILEAEVERLTHGNAKK
jgi:UDP-3-O-[3-hydroxymyristoyl] glucosamine N-acyltransferase